MRQSLVEKRSLLGLKPEWIGKAFLFLMLIYTFHTLFTSQYNIFKTFELKRSLKNIQAKINHYKAENDRMEELLRLIREHPEHFKEKFARRYMQMQRPGEHIFLIKD